MNRLNSIQYVRAFAALIVAIYHFEPDLSKYIEPLGHKLQFIYYFGYTGVDFFFVISGFVIWLTTQKIKKESKIKRVYEFNIKRLLRIYLPYWPLILLIMGAPHLVIDNMASFVRVMTLFPNNILELPLHVTWTLSYELLFYFCFSILLLSSNKKLRLTIIWIIFLFILGLNTYFALVPNSALQQWFYNQENRVFIDYYLLLTMISPLILHFLLGIFTAHFWLTYHEKFTDPKRAKLFKNSMIVLIIGIFLSTWYFKFDPHIFHGVDLSYLRAIILGPLIALFIFSLLLNEKLNPAKENKLLLLFGDGSYLIYLVHVPVHLVLHQRLGPWAINNGYLGLFTVFFCYIAILYVTAIISRYIEIPLYRYLVNFFIRPKKKNAR